jgi:large subunit ribosomal protein L5e
MPFIKKVKSDAYFSRFQVKYRRRREGKTDCQLHHLVDRTLLKYLQTMLANDLSPRQKTSSKYEPSSELHVCTDNIYSNAPKYRLVVRFTNKDIICQIVYARLQGDFILTSARSRELPRYGINHGLTNWSAGQSSSIMLFDAPGF